MPTTFEHGTPISSQDLTHKFRAAESNLQQALRNAAQLTERMRMLELALHSVPALSGQGFYPLVPGPDAEMIGSLVVTRRTESRPSLLLTDTSPDNNATLYAAPGDTSSFAFWSPPEGIPGQGEVVLLEEGAIWARTADTQTATFQARVGSQMLADYNELVIPVISGRVSVTLGRSQGAPYEYNDLTSTTVIRFQSAREFNGHVTVVSEAGTGLSGQYIHTLGGLHVRRSVWASTATAIATYRTSEDKTISINSVRLQPNDEATNFTVYKDGSSVNPASIALLAGDVLSIEVTIPWDKPSSHVELSISTLS